MPYTQDVVVSQVVPNYQSDSSDVVIAYNKLIAAKRRAPGFTSLEGYVAARVFIAGLLAHEGPFTPEALVDDVRDAARPSARHRRDVGLLADEPPVLELGVGHVDPVGRLVQEPLLLERGQLRSSSSSESHDRSAEDTSSDERPAIAVGRYLLHRQIARGGMATIHIARLMGDEGFSPHRRGEAPAPRVRRGRRVRRDVPRRGAHRVEGPSPQRRARARRRDDRRRGHARPGVRARRAAALAAAHARTRQARTCRSTSRSSIACQVLAGLHAAHETVDEMGAPLDIVHRDVSPQNVMVATDGTARLLDFGVAKATMAAHVTREGTFKGKLALLGARADRAARPTQQSDIYSLVGRAVGAARRPSPARQRAGRGRADRRDHDAASCRRSPRRSRASAT